ncbi:dystrophin-like protein [Lates japonicus]|uniref:Dystrophin-like protein n=1 Tax=Lates japonicus TaxID=270547 RepID=A0AAD3NH62_LATJO|nr:dystrophin-like protein [Lates japonicus]
MTSPLLQEGLCLDIEQTQQASDPAELQRWSRLSSRAREELGTLQCILGSMKDNQVCLLQVERWLDAVQELLSRDATGLGTESLQEELNQCKEYVNEIESVEGSLKQMGENVSAVQAAAVPGLAKWGQDKLDESRGRWDTLSKQLLSHQERVAESQEKQVNLRKDLAEMQEWMTQVDEEFLMRDFEYKSPEELEASLEEMKRAKEDVLQKEVKVKILKDSINMLVSRTLPPGGGSGQALTSELEGVLANYHKLCDRFKSKCHTLEEVWSCWMELLQYLDMEQSWLNTVEEKVQATDNLPESTEAVNEALESLESVLRHPGDNRTQIRELGQTLIDGGILDELISEKLEAFNSRYEQLNHQAVNRQISLEQQLQTLKENEQALQSLQESLSQLDHTLTSYLTDRIDAFQLPQEAQMMTSPESGMLEMNQQPQQIETPSSISWSVTANRMYNTARRVGVPHCDMNDLSQWLTDYRGAMSESIGPDGQLTWTGTATPRVAENDEIRWMGIETEFTTTSADVITTHPDEAGLSRS